MKDLLFNPCTSRVKRVLRWLVVRGEVQAPEFKARHVALGGTEHSTHAFDRYFAGKQPQRYSTFVPFGGSHGLIQRSRRAAEGSRYFNQFWYVWNGSLGATFEERAANWLAREGLRTLDRAYQTCERQLIGAIDSEDERDALAWLRAIETATGLRAQGVAA